MNSFVKMPPYPWLQPTWDDFCHRVKLNRLAHSNLIVGTVGLGIEAIARAMSQYLLCSSPIEGVACSNCRACKLVQAGSHPDLLIVETEEKAKQIKIDQVRQISNFVNSSSQYDGRKVVFVRSAEAMNANAANALLKNLEEPAGDTVFLLTSVSPSQILPTIRSRCQAFKIAVPPHERARAWLVTEGIEDPDTWLSLASGAPLKALEWSKGEAATLRQQVFSELGELALGSLMPMTAAARWKSLDPALLIELLTFAIESLIKHFVAGSPIAPELNNLVSHWRLMDTKQLFELKEVTAIRKLDWQRNSNINTQMLYENLILDWYAAGKRGRRQQKA